MTGRYTPYEWSANGTMIRAGADVLRKEFGDATGDEEKKVARVWRAMEHVRAKTAAATEPAAVLILREYLRLYPAFRSMPIGAPYSPKRQEQDAQIAAENKAKALLAKIDGATT